MYIIFPSDYWTLVVRDIEQFIRILTKYLKFEDVVYILKTDRNVYIFIQSHAFRFERQFVRIVLTKSMNSYKIPNPQQICERMNESTCWFTQKYSFFIVDKTQYDLLRLWSGCNNICYDRNDGKTLGTYMGDDTFMCQWII